MEGPQQMMLIHHTMKEGESYVGMENESRLDPTRDDSSTCLRGRLWFPKSRSIQPDMVSHRKLHAVGWVWSLYRLSNTVLLLSSACPVHVCSTIRRLPIYFLYENRCRGVLFSQCCHIMKYPEMAMSKHTVWKVILLYPRIHRSIWRWETKAKIMTSSLLLYYFTWFRNRALFNYIHWTDRCTIYLCDFVKGNNDGITIRHVFVVEVMKELWI